MAFEEYEVDKLSMSHWIIVLSLLLISLPATFSMNHLYTRYTVDEQMEHRTVFGVERKLDIPSNIVFEEAHIEVVESFFGTNCSHDWFDSCVDGAKLHYRKWRPAGKPNAIVVFAHGIHTHSGNCSPQANALARKGYAVYSHDYLGHGYSEGRRWLIPKTWKNLLADYRTFVNLVASKHDPDTPLFLMGESYGSSLTLNLARQFQDRPETGPANLDSVILTAGAFQADLPPYPVLLVLRFILAPLFPRWTPFFMPAAEGEEESEDRIQQLALQLHLDKGWKPPCLGTAEQLVRTLKTTRRHTVPGFALPYCILHGTNDTVCPIDGAEYLWETAETPEAEREFHRLEGVAHDVFEEASREDSTKIVLRWIHKRLLKRQKKS